MAPEQLTGGRPTPAADIYALGVMLYEMVAGRRPFAGHSPSEQLALQAEPPMAFTAPAALTQVVMAMLDPVPDRRPDATQVGRAFRAWLDDRTETDAPTAAAPSSPPASRPVPLAREHARGLRLSPASR
jgi:serine/threonine protein kinase